MINNVSFAGKVNDAEIRKAIIEKGKAAAKKNAHNYLGTDKVYSKDDLEFAKALLEESNELTNKQRQVLPKAEFYNPYSSNVILKNDDTKMMEKSYAEAHGNKFDIIA